jgi:transcription initiation factor TFIIIB Brf1 subunit/transcription initiation factor TFIIB
MIKNIRQVKLCPECGSDNIVYNDRKEQVVCKDCGEIYEPMVPEDEEEFEKLHELE